MFARRLYKLVRRSARPPVQPGEPEQPDESEQPDEPEPFYEPLREEDEESLTQRLYGLDRSSAQFLERLDELLQDEGWMKDIERLSRHKLVKLIDYLDNVRFISTPTKSCSSSSQILDGLDRTGSQFKEGLHALRKLCGSREIVPTTCLVSGKLSISTTIIVEPGAYGEIRKGSLDDADVCIKNRPNNLPDSIRKVSCPHNISLDCHALTSFEVSLQGGRDMEVPRSPKYCVLQGCHPQTPSTRVGMDTLQRVGRIYQGKSACRLDQSREFILPAYKLHLILSSVARHCRRA